MCKMHLCTSCTSYPVRPKLLKVRQRHVIRFNFASSLSFFSEATPFLQSYSSQRCWIGLRSGFCAGKYKSFTLNWEKH